MMVSDKFNNPLQLLSRKVKQALMLVTDVVLLVLSSWGAFALRAQYDSYVSTGWMPNNEQIYLIAAAPLIAVPLFIRMGLYRSVIRYLGNQAVWTIAQAVALLTVLWTTLAFFMLLGGKSWDGVPRMVPFLFMLLAFVSITGSRFLARWIIWRPIQRKVAGRQILIYGANEAGVQLAASLRQSGQFFPAGFIDDDPHLQGKDLGGSRVYPPERLEELQRLFGIKEIIVTMPTNRATRKQIVQYLEKHPIKVRVLPPLTDIVSGKHLVNLVKEIDIEDLLGRSPVAPDPALLEQCIKNKNVLVSGAGGSIGSELCQQILKFKPKQLILLEQNEYALYQIERALLKLSDVDILPCLGSVQNLALVTQLLRERGVQTVYHAAAYKHVPLVESNLPEGVMNNVFGTWNMAKAAFEQQVETFVLISTDKAVRPTNAMGACKRWAELVVQYYATLAAQKKNGQRFCAVRFGNVLGSSGSVIPLFKEQIARGGPITVTDPEIIRFFMSIHEAVELVIQAGSMARGGDVFLLDMGKAVKIHDLARDMIRLAGYSVRDEQNPNGEIEIVFTGLRPGEKLYEELLISGDNVAPTRHEKIMRGDEPFPGCVQLERLLEQLRGYVEQQDEAKARQLLMKIAMDEFPLALVAS